MSQQPKDLEKLSPAEKRALLDKLLREKAEKANKAQTIQPAPRTGPLWASFAQEQLWFAEQMQPGAYNVANPLRLKGTLDVGALERALGELQRRHEVLRTTFTAVDGKPAQVIAPPTPVRLAVVDLSGLSPQEREAEEARLTHEEAHGLFDLSRGPLWRLRLLRLGEREHVLLSTMHHAIVDNWSWSVLFRELSALYEAFLAGKPSPLPEPPVQFADFALWQREQMRGSASEAQVSWWKQQLTGAPAVLQLPLDRPRPAIRKNQGRLEALQLSPELREGLEALARREKVSLFMVLVAAWQTLLGRYSGQTDISIGTPVAGRQRMELEGLIGFFINTVVLRTRLSGELSFRELLARVREVALGAYAHQEVPFERLVEELHPERSLSHTPLFQVMININTDPLPAMRMPGLTVEMAPPDTSAQFDLLLSLLNNANGGMDGWLLYDTALFDATTIQRMAGHLLTLLEGVVRAPDTRLDRLPLLTQQERRTVVSRWNAVRAELPQEACLHRLFEEQVQRTPQQVALDFAGTRLTYAELDARANRLAQALLRRGVKPETRVGLFLERSPEQLITVLGILKAGGAYVPLDPGYPPERLDYMLEDCRPMVVVTHSRLRERLGAFSGQVLCLDEAGEELAGLGDAAPRVRVLPENTAYVIYTSGSTGRSKGVIVPHQGVCNMALELIARMAAGPGDRMTQLCSISFDGSVQEMFTALLSGATLVPATRDFQQLEQDLTTVLAESGLTSVGFVPSVLATLEPTRLPNVKRLIAGGEAVPTELVERWAPQARFFNMYGPTEASVTVTVAECKAGGGKPSIGRPLANVQVYVLDEHFQPVPIGVPGELYVGGLGLARGYLDRPELTAERFIPDSVSGVPGSRLYRTGDLVRYLADGNLEYLGRVDQQVKIRGYRIELGEIESALARHPMVREVAVVAREDVPGDKRLVAYVVADAAGFSPGALRQHLQERLPPYMVPSAFARLDTLPLTPNGKVDARALPPPPEERAESERYEAPTTSVQEALARIFAQVLGVSRVGIQDDFFALGGHSLMATQVTSRVREELHVELPLRLMFESPTVAALAEAVQAELGRSADTLPPIERVGRQQAPTTSFAQERLWFLEQLRPEEATYNFPISLRLKGALDVAALERALGEIRQRHETLRTTFVMEGERPVQRIAPPAPLTLPVVDLSGLSPKEREAEEARLTREETRAPFDLAQGPVWRLRLLRLGAQEHVLLSTMHHIVTDGGSVEVLFKELAALYGAFHEGRPSPLAELPVQYADFAAWQRRWLEGRALEEQLSYWKQQLAGAPALLELPTDRPRPPVQTYRGDVEPLNLPPELLVSLRTLCQEEKASLFMLLAAAFKVVLARYSGQEDISVGTPVSNRSRVELEGLIGFFANTLVLRTRLSGAPTFRELLRRVRETTLAAHARQDLPFEKLVEELQPERNLSHGPLFQVMFSLLPHSRTPLELSGLKATATSLEVGATKFDLALSLEERADRIEGGFEYNTDLFDRATLTRMGQHLRTLLEAAVARPDERIDRLPLLPSSERRQLLVEWNDTARELPRGQCLQELFEAQVARTPEAVALVFEGQRLSYRELEARANQLARHLRGLGVGPEARVALCAERSLELVVALLAILKAGGAYVPLDPSYPAERLATLLEDAQAPVLLVQERVRSRLPTNTRTRVVSLDGDASAFAREETGPLRVAMRDTHLAYVIYTSGSTGQPKGAMNEHRAVANRLLWMQAEYRLTSEDVVLQKTPFSFDVSVWEFFWPLLVGARLVLARPEGHKDSTYLARLIQEQGVTMLHFVPSMLQAFLDDAESRQCRGLRRVICSGEALPYELKERFQSTLPAELHNLYGPTEAAVDVSYWDCRRELERRVVPIGRPISNTRLYVLDRRMEPVPVGVAGELYIGGVAVGRGYLGRPELTAERFVADPFSSEPGARLYRTGDLTRLLPGGEIEYLGRLDHQVKLRGFRIELGEIEAVLARHPAVREAVVMAREDRPGDKRLVAYVTPRVGAEAASVETLRAFLEERLPGYMVPSAFVSLETMPLSPNGKADRKALPVPELPESEHTDSVAPRTPVEEVVAGTFADVLGLERVGATEDFFALGGHSLLATRVMARLREALGVELPLQRLFEAPTVSALAASFEQALRQGQGSTLLPLRQMPRESAPELSFAQERYWVLHHLDPKSAVHNVPSGWKLTGPLDVPALERALSELIRRHEILRTTFSVVGSRPGQVIHPPSAVSLPVVQLSGMAELERHVREEANRPFDLARGPLWRHLLLRLGEREHVLLWTMHHIITDQHSNELLFEELSALYGAFRAGTSPALPEPALQYADFAQSQREWLTGRVQEEQLGWWKQQLAGAPTALELPTDRPRPAVLTFRGAQVPVRIPAPVLERLEQLSRREGGTLFMTILAAYGVLLSRYAGQEDIVIGSPVSGRPRAELDKVFGYFLNSLALRVRMEGRPTFRELLRRVRQACLGAYAHQDVPFERLVNALQPERDLSRAPLTQTSLVLLPGSRSRFQLPELGVEPLERDMGVARYELSLMLGVEPDGLSGVLEYNSDLFDGTSIERMARGFAALLESIATHPDAHISTLSLWPPGERERVVRGWNDTRRDFPAEQPVQALFEAQVDRTPDALAVLFNGQQLSYRELDTRANQLAWHLRRLGLRPGERVALCVDPSLEVIVALYGVLKAGGTYVPLDPTTPRERLAFIFRDASIRLVLTQEHLAAALPTESLQVLKLDADWGSVVRESRERPPSVTVPQLPAYVIYTSGTTGEPKGVVVPHRAVVNHNTGVAARFELRPGDRVLQFTPINFDAAGEEIYPPLLSGAAIVVRGELVPGPEFRDLIERERLSVLSLPPAYLHEWASEMDRQGLKVPGCLRLVLLGGEKLLPETWRLWQRIGGERIPWLNVYGPTEATVTSAMCEISTQGMGLDTAVLPIGTPVANAQMYLLDANLEPVLVGLPGEIFIGGAGLAHGYLNRPDLTAEKFVPDPFSTEPGARLYRTGDLARFLPDGRIEFLGRGDHQVKLRGHRIELAEVEAAMRRHPHIQDAVALVRESPPGNKRLVGYFVPKDAELMVAQVQGFMRDQLPAYMVPTAYVKLAAMPLTSNGKVDRKALPLPETTVAQDASYVAPRTEREVAMARLWEEVLDVRPVGVTNNFFDLGGHSLLAIRLLGRAQQELGVELPMTEFFERPTIEGMLRDGLLEETQEEDETPPLGLVPIQAEGTRRPLFGIHPLFGDVQAYYQLAHRFGFDQPTYGLRAPERDSEETFDTVEARAAYYADVIRHQQPQGPYVLLGYTTGATLALEVARRLQARGQEVSLVALLHGTLGVPGGQKLAPDAADASVLEAHWETMKFQFALEYERFGRPERWAAMLEQARTQQGNSTFGAQDLRPYARVARSTLRALERHEPAPYSGRVVQFVASNEPVTAPAGDDALGWRRLCQNLEVISLPCDSRAMLDSPHVDVIAERLQKQLAEEPRR
jgi:amino acid adenylation domain-containing protein